MAIDRFVLKDAVRKALRVIKGLRRHVSDVDENVIDVIVLKLLEEFDVAGYEIVKSRAMQVSHSRHQAATGAYSLTRLYAG